MIASRIDAASSARFANLKFAAAVLIVVQHVFNIMRPGVHDVARSFIVSGITGVAVPLFFFASGCFLALHFDDKGWWARAVIKRIRTLVLPFLVWNISCLAATAGFSWDESDLVGLLWHMPAYNVTWFLRALFIFVLVAPVVKIIISRKDVGCLILVMIFCLHVFANIFHVVFLEALEWFFPIKGLVYFYLGAYMAGHGLSLNCIPMLVAAVCGAVSVAIMISAAFSWVFPLEIVVIAYPLMILFLWRFTPSKPWPKSLTDKGFALYLVSAHQRTDFAEGAGFAPPRLGTCSRLASYAASSCTSTRSNDATPSGASTK